jgi:octanoyl-[GcvH]:protein N-octanoyltransferase
MQAFGGPVSYHVGDAEDGMSFATAADDMDRVRRILTGLNDGGPGSLRIYRPQPTAAFAPRDTTLAAYAEAAEAMRRLGFTPVERWAGGQLAVYDARAVVIDLVVPHDEPRHDVIERFRIFSSAIAEALRVFSIDARVGQVEGEYCPGDYSVNADGRIKLAGVAQRVVRKGYHLGAVISLETSEQAREAVSKAYRIYGFPFAPESFGSIADVAGRVPFAVLRASLLAALRQQGLSLCG